MNPLRLVLGIAALVNAVLVGFSIVLWSRMRRLEAELVGVKDEAKPAR